MIKEAFGTGATLDEAKEAALKALGAPEDDSDFVPIAQNIVCSFSATAPEEETETE